MHDTTRFLVAGDMHTRADASATAYAIVHTRTVPTAFAAIIAVPAKTMTNTEATQNLQPHLREEEETKMTDVDMTVLCPRTNTICSRSALLGKSDPATFGIRIRPICGPSYAKVETCVNNRQRNNSEYLDTR